MSQEQSYSMNDAQMWGKNDNDHREFWWPHLRTQEEQRPGVADPPALTSTYIGPEGGVFVDEKSADTPALIPDVTNDPIVTRDGWTAPQRVWEALSAKEDLEEMWLTQQFHASQQKLYADFMTYKQEMQQRRMRFANKVGPQITLEQAYHVPFWQWWGEYLNRKY